jgi:hypothetical protein
VQQLALDPFVKGEMKTAFLSALGCCDVVHVPVCHCAERGERRTRRIAWTEG